MQRKSTRQLLRKIPGFPCLYRHDVDKTYYGITKVLGNRKVHSLGTTDCKLAQRNLKAWIQGLAEIAPSKARKKHHLACAHTPALAGRDRQEANR